jgi:RNA polymerase sigma-70 factor (ECF subfamily)
LESDQTEATDPITAPIDSAEFDEFWGWGRRYARRLLANEADSEDVVQEAFCRLVAKHARSEGESAEPRSLPRPELAAIFFTTVRNLCVDRLRRIRPRSNLDAQEWIEHFPSAEGIAIAKETRELIRRGLARLPDRWRQALLLRAAFELNYEEISQIMGCTKARIRTWIFRARQQLSGELQLEGRQ